MRPVWAEQFRQRLRACLGRVETVSVGGGAEGGTLSGGAHHPLG